MDIARCSRIECECVCVVSAQCIITSPPRRRAPFTEESLLDFLCTKENLDIYAYFINIMYYARSYGRSRAVMGGYVVSARLLPQYI